MNNVLTCQTRKLILKKLNDCLTLLNQNLNIDFKALKAAVVCVIS